MRRESHLHRRRSYGANVGSSRSSYLKSHRREPGHRSTRQQRRSLYRQAVPRYGPRYLRTDLSIKRCCRYFLTQFFAKRWIGSRTRGRVLFTGSINGLLAEPTHTAYDASKAAVAGLVRSLCVALAPHGIRVNSMAPGLVRTPLTNQILDHDAAALKWMKLHTPNGEVPAADVCGGAAVFLLSDLAEHIHGQTLYVDGGMSVWQQPDLPPELGAARL